LFVDAVVVVVAAAAERKKNEITSHGYILRD
jgi:hypothetical protein